MAIKYKWLVEQLREIISDSIQKGINKLPTEQELAARYRVSRQTVRSGLRWRFLKMSGKSAALKGAELTLPGFPAWKTRI